MCVPVHDVGLVKPVEKMTIAKVKRAIPNSDNARVRNLREEKYAPRMEIVKAMYALLVTLMGHGSMYVVHLVVESTCRVLSSRIFVPKAFPMGKDVLPMIRMVIVCVRVGFV